MQLSRENACLEVDDAFLLGVGQRIGRLRMALGCAIGLMTQIEVDRLIGERFATVPHHRAQEL